MLRNYPLGIGKFRFDGFPSLTDSLSLCQLISDWQFLARTRLASSRGLGIGSFTKGLGQALLVFVFWWSRLGTFVMLTPHCPQFTTEPDSRYSTVLNFGPSNQITYLTFCTMYSVVDAFTCTNGNFYPDSSAHISEMIAFPRESTAMPRLPPF